MTTEYNSVNPKPSPGTGIDPTEGRDDTMEGGLTDITQLKIGNVVYNVSVAASGENFLLELSL